MKQFKNLDKTKSMATPISMLQIFTYLKSTRKTLENGVNYTQSQQKKTPERRPFYF